MKTVDERVVDMQFNNKQFQDGIGQSLNSLDKLSESLKLKDAGKGFDNLDRTAKSFSLKGISDGVDYISSRFSALSVVGVTALANITNSAMETGKRMLSALTIDPIKTGLQEYETKIGAIQTILTNTASKGTTLDDVNKALAELNTYSDQTIYNFAEMAKNIGTFTAGGVDLKTSVSSIKGIANLAAGSGSNAEQASTAMYQLSQAIAAGSVKLMDWNSVVNAGMGGELFQKALKQTAKEMGIFVDEATPFRQTLESGWLTSEVLTTTLSKLAEDKALVQAATQVKTFTQLFNTMKESVQSGWAVSWENIIGNKDQAAKTLTAINDAFGAMVGKSADARNEMLKFWNANGGRDALIEGLSNAFKGLASILKPVRDAFKEIFPPMTGQSLVEITKGFRDLTEQFKIGEETSKNLKNTFKGLFALVDIVGQLFSAAVSSIKPLLQYFGMAGDGVLGFTGSIGEYIVKLDEYIKKTGFFKEAFEKLGEILKPIADVVKKGVQEIGEAFNSFKDVDTSGLDTFSEKVKTRFEPFTKLIDFIKTCLGLVFKLLKKIAPIFAALASVIGKGLGALQDKIATSIESADYKGLLDLINGGLLAAIFLGIKKFVSSLTNIASGAKGILSSIKGILDGVRECFEAYQTNIKANTLMKIAIAIALLSGSIIALSMVDSGKLNMALKAMTVMFAELMGSMLFFQKGLGPKGIISMGRITKGMIGMATAVLILSFAMKNIAELDWNGIAKGLVSVAALCGMLVASAKLLSASSKTLIRGGLGFILFAEAITILATAVEKLGKLDTKSLIKGLVGVGVVMAELVLFMKATDVNKLGIGKAAGILVLAAAINVLAGAVSKFGAMDEKTLLKGLLAIAMVLTELSLFVNATGNAKKVISTAIGLTILGAAMKIFASAIEDMGSMSMEQIGKGLLTLAGALGAVTLAVNFMPKNMIAKGLGMIGIAAAILILSNALNALGSMSWGEVARGLVALAGALALVVAAAILMQSALPGAGAMLVMAGALAILAPVLEKFGKMSLNEIGKGLLALAGVFAVIGLSAVILGPVVPVILALAGAIALMGVGCALAGVGILAFSAGLAALAVSGSAGAAAIVLIVTSLLSLIPLAMQKIGEGIIAFCDVIIQGVPKICEAIGVIITNVIALLVSKTPVIVEGVVQMLLAILKCIADHIEEIVTTALKIIVGFIEGVINMLPQVIEVAFKFIIAFIEGLADAIANNGPTLLLAVGKLFLAVLEAIVKTLLGGLNLLKEIGSKIINSGFIQGIKDKFVDIVDTVKRIPRMCLDALMEKVVDFAEMGKNLIMGFINGIKDSVTSAVNAVKEFGGKIVNGFKDVFDIHSPSRVFAEIGRYCDLGFADGILKYANVIDGATKSIGDNATSSLQGALSGISLDTMDNQPTIRPVMDLTNVISGSKQINSMFSTRQALIASENAVNLGKSANNNSLTSSLNKANQESSNRLIDAINKGYSIMDKMTEKLSNMSIVMDSGELVGAISGKVDSSLGTATVYKRRSI